ncbi:MAG TPA: amidase family protein [Acidimicrobiales bacterium]|jgi:aspartyl-tRNA(Asn)/glutamyl-tRNA(Gln) amidotransferase subunit A|nr:amidase family protein [Acidimicrobiales bacterium]
MDFRKESLADLAESVRAGKVGARELVQHAIDRIEMLDDQVNAFTAVDGDTALATARALDERIARGEDAGDLAGIPIGVKDLEDAAGFTTSHGSAAWANGPAATADSILVTRLKAAGCIVVGKTNTPELGWKGETENPVFGATRNPWNLAHSPGGSSGGSAAAIAAGMVPLATGSDGGGSIRIPSALCGLSGMKVSLGRVPAGGPEPPGWGLLSSKGPLARRIADVVYALDQVIGPDPSDMTSLPMPEPSWLGALEHARVPLRVAWSPTLGYANVDEEVREVCERGVRVLADMGAEVTEVDTVFPEDPVWDWLKLTSVYCLRLLDQYRDTDVWERIDPGLRAQVARFGDISAVELARAEDACHLLNVRLVRLFHDVRLLATPTVAAPVPRSGEVGVINGEPAGNWVQFTYPFNMTRSPAATVTVGFTAAGLPVGLQLVGPQHGDLVVLRAAAALEEAVALDPVAPLG